MSATALTPARIEKLRRRLDARLGELEAQLDEAEGSARPVELDQQSFGRVSRIDAIQQQQMALANREQAAGLAQLIRSALERIDGGSYGYCLRCEEPIARARLEAQPHVTLCLECQAASER